MLDVLMTYPEGGPRGDLYSASEAGPASTSLRELGLSTTIERFSVADCGREDFLDELAPSACVVAILQWEAIQTHEWLRALISSLNGSEKTIYLVCLGDFPSCVYREILEEYPRIDAVVLGEGEVTLGPAIRCLFAKGDLNDVAGVGFRNQDRVHVSKPKVIRRDLEKFPRADTRYFTNKREYPLIPILSSRGCSNACTYCAVTQFREFFGNLPAYRTRGAEEVVQEIEYLVDTLGRKMFYFVDSSFIVNQDQSRQRAVEIAEEIAKRGLRIHFYIESRADAIDRETFQILRDVGLRSVLVGVENGSQAVLDRVHKNVSVDDTRRAIGTLRDLNISIHMGYILFDPLTTTGELEQNIRFIQELKLQHAIPPQTLYCRMVMFPRMPGVCRPEELEIDERIRQSELPAWSNRLRNYRIVDPSVREIEWALRQARSFLGSVENLLARRVAESGAGARSPGGPPEDRSPLERPVELLAKWKKDQPEILLESFVQMVASAGDWGSPDAFAKSAEEIWRSQLEAACRATLDKSLSQVLGNA